MHDPLLLQFLVKLARHEPTEAPIDSLVGVTRPSVPTVVIAMQPPVVLVEDLLFFSLSECAFGLASDAPADEVIGVVEGLAAKGTGHISLLRGLDVYDL